MQADTDSQVAQPLGREALHTLRVNLTRVRERIANACTRARRDPRDVTLIAVTKYAGLDVIRALIGFGVCELGESRVQQLTPRAAALRPLGVRWHLVGHLQRNKAKYLLPDVRIVHSVDSLPLAQKLSEQAERAAGTFDVFLEVSIAGETQKHGVEPDGLRELATDVRSLPRVRVCGLMALAPRVREPEQTRPYFARLRTLRDELRDAGALAAEAVGLSMGMTADFDIAIEEGATHVRIGSALFEDIDPDVLRANTVDG